jgi:hypothetical protein
VADDDVIELPFGVSGLSWLMCGTRPNREGWIFAETGLDCETEEVISPSSFPESGTSTTCALVLGIPLGIRSVVCGSSVGMEDAVWYDKGLDGKGALLALAGPVGTDMRKVDGEGAGLTWFVR